MVCTSENSALTNLSTHLLTGTSTKVWQYCACSLIFIDWLFFPHLIDTLLNHIEYLSKILAHAQPRIQSLGDIPDITVGCPYACKTCARIHALEFTAIFSASTRKELFFQRRCNWCDRIRLHKSIQTSSCTTKESVAGVRLSCSKALSCSCAFISCVHDVVCFLHCWFNAKLELHPVKRCYEISVWKVSKRKASDPGETFIGANFIIIHTFL